MRRGTVARADGDALKSARITLTTRQTLGLTLIVTGVLATTTIAPLSGSVVLLSLQIGFMSLAAWRLFLLWNSRLQHLSDTPQICPDPSCPWPRYTVVSALYQETSVLPQLIERLSDIDYPRERLEGFLVLETDDAATIKVALDLPRPDWLQVLIVPPGAPIGSPQVMA